MGNTRKRLSVIFGPLSNYRLVVFQKDEADDFFFPANGRLLFVQHLRSAFRPFFSELLLSCCYCVDGR